jgi:hypothetical protein
MVRDMLSYGLGTLVAFAVALYVARGAEADQDVLEQAAVLADDVLATIHNAQLSGKHLTYLEQTEGLPTIRATQEMADADARACAAAGQAVSPQPRPQTTVMSSGAVVVTEPAQPVDAQRRIDEGERMQQCMRQKGYRLKPTS